MGTGGTISGVGRYLKEQNPDVVVVGADPAGSVYSGGSGRPYLVEGVGEDFWPETYDRDIADRIIEVSDAHSFAMTRQLAREEGLLVGGSSGMAAYAAVQLAQELDDPDAVIVVLLPDSGRGYLTKVFNDDWLARFGFLTGSRSGVTIGEVLHRKKGDIPALVHTHPSETIAEAVQILQEYAVSQMPVVLAEPPDHGRRGGRIGLRAATARRPLRRGRAARRPGRAAHGRAAADGRCGCRHRGGDRGPA